MHCHYLFGGGNSFSSKLKPPHLLTGGIECLVLPWDLPPSWWHDIYYCVFVILYLFNGLLLTINALSWKKVADLVAKATPAIPQVPAAATVELQNLQSLPLSALLVDDSGPPQVTYKPQQPIATSTSRATSTESPEISTEAYRQILPGMSS